MMKSSTILSLFLLVLLSACGLIPTPPPTATPTITPSPTAVFTPTPSPTSETPRIPETFEDAPETITATLPPDEEGGQAREMVLTKSNLSTIFSDLVIYRDENDKAQMVMVLGTGEVKDLRQAGIAELDLTTSEKLEMRFFDNAKEAIEYLATDNVRMTGSKGDYSQYPKILEKLQVALKIVKSIVDISEKSMGVWPSYADNKKEFFYLGARNIKQGGIVMTTITADGNPKFALLDDPNMEETYLNIWSVFRELDYDTSG